MMSPFQEFGSAITSIVRLVMTFLRDCTTASNVHLHFAHCNPLCPEKRICLRISKDWPNLTRGVRSEAYRMYDAVGFVRTLETRNCLGNLLIGALARCQYITAADLRSIIPENAGLCIIANVDKIMASVEALSGKSPICIFSREFPNLWQADAPPAFENERLPTWIQLAVKHAIDRPDDLTYFEKLLQNRVLIQEYCRQNGPRLNRRQIEDTVATRSVGRDPRLDLGQHLRQRRPLDDEDGEPDRPESRNSTLHDMSGVNLYSDSSDSSAYSLDESGLGHEEGNHLMERQSEERAVNPPTEGSLIQMEHQAEVPMVAPPLPEGNPVEHAQVIPPPPAENQFGFHLQAPPLPEGNPVGHVQAIPLPPAENQFGFHLQAPPLPEGNPVGYTQVIPQHPAENQIGFHLQAPPPPTDDPTDEGDIPAPPPSEASQQSSLPQTGQLDAKDERSALRTDRLTRFFESFPQRRFPTPYPGASRSPSPAPRTSTPIPNKSPVTFENYIRSNNPNNGTIGSDDTTQPRSSKMDYEASDSSMDVSTRPNSPSYLPVFPPTSEVVEVVTLD